jgi:hypothetical protein
MEWAELALDKLYLNTISTSTRKINPRQPNDKRDEQ